MMLSTFYRCPSLFNIYWLFGLSFVGGIGLGFIVIRITQLSFPTLMDYCAFILLAMTALIAVYLITVKCRQSFLHIPTPQISVMRRLLAKGIILALACGFFIPGSLLGLKNAWQLISIVVIGMVPWKCLIVVSVLPIMSMILLMYLGWDFIKIVHALTEMAAKGRNTCHNDLPTES